MYRSFQAWSNSRIAPRKILGAISILWLSSWTGLIWLGVADGGILSDDAYYYFEIARNAALGEGFTYDGLSPTNGFHPLWAWLLVPIFYAFPASAWAPIHLALTLSGLCVVASAVGVFLLFSRYDRAEAGLIAATLWLLNPYTWILAARGLEGPLNVLCIVIAVLALDSIRRRGVYSQLDAVALGGAAGLCLLARTDNVLLLAAFSLVLAGDLARGKLGALVALKRGLLLASATTLVLSPWLIWTLSTFGTVVQSSHEAKSIFPLYGRLPTLGTGLEIATGMVTNLGLIATHNAQYIAGEEWMAINLGWWVIAFAAGVAGVATLSAWLFRSRRGRGPTLGPIALFALLHVAWYGWVARSYYNWYFLPLTLVWCLLVGDAFGRAWVSRLRPMRAGVSATIVVVALSSFWLGARHVRGWEPGQGETEFIRSDAGVRLAELPGRSHAGAWNAGRIGYFASFHSDAVVINLDGVVNNRLVRHVRDRPYESFILEHVDWLVEDPTELGKYVGEERMLAFFRDHVDADGRIVGGARPD